MNLIKTSWGTQSKLKNLKHIKSVFVFLLFFTTYSLLAQGNSILELNRIKVDGISAVVGDYVILAGMVAVHQFCTIGDHAFISGGSLVRKDVPPYVKAAREPLSYVGINSVGLRRRGFSSKKIKEIQDIYRLLYQKNYNNTQAIEILEAEMVATPERDEILQFIMDSQRGIMKGYFNKL